MSVYNGEQFLIESVESVLNQTFSDFEFLIFDDASTDNSYKILYEFAKKDNRIILYKNEENIGLTKSLNKAIQIAKAQYIARADADDINLPLRFEKQIEFLESNPDIFLAGSWAKNIENTGEIGRLIKNEINEKKIKKILAFRNTILHPTIMFRNSDNFLYREKFIFSQDYDFYLQLLSANKLMANIPLVLILYRVHSQSISVSKHAKQRLFAQKAAQFFAERQKYGSDSYDLFYPNEILCLDEENSIEKKVIEAQIYSCLQAYNAHKLRLFSRKYLFYYGIFNKFLLYYILSFFNKKFYNLVKKVI
jgi:glycosyltransferase involved in cell wall biosynthesis